MRRSSRRSRGCKRARERFGVPSRRCTAQARIGATAFEGCCMYFGLSPPTERLNHPKTSSEGFGGFGGAFWEGEIFFAGGRHEVTRPLSKSWHRCAADGAITQTGPPERAKPREYCLPRRKPAHRNHRNLPLTYTAPGVWVVSVVLSGRAGYFQPRKQADTNDTEENHSLSFCERLLW